jgi:hypothetical protein
MVIAEAMSNCSYFLPMNQPVSRRAVFLKQRALA